MNFPHEAVMVHDAIPDSRGSYRQSLYASTAQVCLSAYTISRKYGTRDL